MMRKLTFMLLCMITLCVSVVKADNEQPIQVEQLPVAARQFVNLHFAGRKVALAKVETELMSKTYEVIFADGDHVEFDSKGSWKEIDCRSSSVPTAAVPVAIMDYVRKNYPDVAVKKIEKDRKEYEVKLSNRIELTFDLKFNLTDIDM